jgi:hypothetical protein
MDSPLGVAVPVPVADVPFRTVRLIMHVAGFVRMRMRMVLVRVRMFMLMRMSVAMIVMMGMRSVMPVGMAVPASAEIAERPERDPQAEPDQREAGDR